MPKKNKLHWMQLDVQDWLTSETVSGMSLASQGAYIRALCIAWCDDTCSITADEKKLRRLLGAEAGVEWDEVWDDLQQAFIEEDGRLYNPRQREEWNTALGRAEQSRVNGAKGGRPPKDKSARRATPEPEPEPKKSALSEPDPELDEPESNGKVESVADILERVEGSDEGYDIEAEIRGWVGDANWNAHYGFYRWFLLEIPTAMQSIDHIRRSKNARIREAERLTEVRDVHAHLRGCAKKHVGKGVQIPYSNSLNPKYTNKVELA